MKTSLARLVSIAGHPFVLLAIFVFLLTKQDDPHGVPRMMAAFAAIVLAPLGLLIWHSRRSGRWRTVDASDKTDRPVLYLTCGLILLVAATYLYFVERSWAAVRGCLAFGAMLLVAFAANRRTKLSLHVACAVFCGAILANARLTAGLTILLLTPLLMWSRVVLSRHSFAETIGGAILGGFGASIYLLRG